MKNTQGNINCPVCGCDTVHPINYGLSLRKRFVCVDCKSVWQSACSRIEAIVSMVIGVILLLVFGWYFLEGVDYVAHGQASDDRGAGLVPFVTMPAVGIGIYWICYGVGVLKGRCGKMKILFSGSAPEVKQ